MVAVASSASVDVDEHPRCKALSVRGAGCVMSTVACPSCNSKFDKPRGTPLPDICPLCRASFTSSEVSTAEPTRSSVAVPDFP